MDYLGSSFVYDPFGGIIEYASKACYKQYEYKVRATIKQRDFTIQLSGGLHGCNGPAQYAAFLVKLKKTCVTKIISYDTPEFFNAIVEANKAGAGWKASDVIIERTGDYYNWEINDPLENFGMKARYKCNMIYVVLDGVKLFYMLEENPSVNWKTLTDSDKVKRAKAISRFEIELQNSWGKNTANSQIEQLYKKYFPDASVSIRAANKNEVDLCRQRVVQAEVILWQMNMGVLSQNIPFAGFIIDEPDPANPRLKEYYEAIVGLREEVGGYFNNDATKSVLMIDHFKNYEDLAGKCDYIYSDQYDDTEWWGGEPETDDIINHWAENNVDGAYLYLYEWLFRGGSSGDWKNRLEQAEFDKTVEAAKKYGLNNLLLFFKDINKAGVTYWSGLSWNTETYFIEMTCDGLIDLLNVICKKLIEHNWFYEGHPAYSAYKYKYCIYYPDCRRCPKDKEDLWTDQRPEGFPAIDPDSNSIVIYPTWSP